MHNKEVTAASYQREALVTEKTPNFVNGSDGLPNEEMSRLWHGACGMETEVGELQDMLKKHVIYGKPFDPVNVLEECGDVMWYVALALDACGFTIEQAMDRNLAKLRARYGGKFTPERAISRDLETERKILEGQE